MVQSITHLTSEWHHKSTAMLLNCDTTTSQSPLHQYFTLLTLHSAYKKQPSQGSVISGKPLFPYPLANGSAVASFMGEIVSMSLPLSTTFCSSHVLLNRIHHWVSMLDSLSSCIVHDHTFPSSPAFTLKSINVSPYGWAPHEFSQWNFSVDLHHFLLKNCRWFQPRCFPHLITSVTSACWADPTASSHLLTNRLNTN